MAATEAYVPKAAAPVLSVQRVAEALDGVGLAKFGNALPRELSGGMQMRASFANEETGVPS